MSGCHSVRCSSAAQRHERVVRSILGKKIYKNNIYIFILKIEWAVIAYKGVGGAGDGLSPLAGDCADSEIPGGVVGDIEIEAGSGHVFADLGSPDADILKIKSGLTSEMGRLMHVACLA